jgi:hypothetical protein
MSNSKAFNHSAPTGQQLEDGWLPGAICRSRPSEGLFSEVAARQSNDIAAILEKFGCLVVGPTLLEGLHSINSPRT